MYQPQTQLLNIPVLSDWTPDTQVNFATFLLILYQHIEFSQFPNSNLLSHQTTVNA